MKAFNFQTETAAYAGSFEDVIFENRNKQYGAYFLRKNYSNHLFYAFTLTASFILLIVFYPIIKNHLYPTKPIIKEVTFYEPFDPTEIQIDEPIVLPPPPMPIVNNVLRIENAFVLPVVVDQPIIETVINTELPQSSLLPVDEGATGFGNNIPIVFVPEIENTDTGIYIVEEPALFNGSNVLKFREWLLSKLQYPEYLQDANIQGKVVIEFAVNKKGEVCDVKIIKSLHRMLDTDLTKLILSSPAWQPAKNNGTPIKQRMYIPFVFELN